MKWLSKLKDKLTSVKPEEDVLAQPETHYPAEPEPQPAPAPSGPVTHIPVKDGKRTEMTIELFRKIKGALADNKFKTQASIGRRYGVSVHTIQIVKLASSFKQYKEIRRGRSNAGSGKKTRA